MDVVVTGSAGFIGQHLVGLLLVRGHQVIGIDRRPRPDDGTHPHLVTDLSAPAGAARAALAAADVVVHLAGCPGVRDGRPDVGRHRYRDNVAALRETLALVRADASTVVTSSSSVYGGTAFGRASHEDDVVAPRGGYARSKVLAEAVCAQAQARGARITVVRPFTVVGEGQRADMALYRWVRAARRGAPLTVLGSLERTRDLTDVRDAVRVLADLAVLAPGRIPSGIPSGVPSGIPSGIVNLGSGQPISLRQMVSAVAEVTSTRPTVRVTAAGDEEVSDTLADTGRLVDLTGRRLVTDLLDVVNRVDASIDHDPRLLLATG